ncbi:sigma-70 family RNA polymerase sigma factor, partial [Streptomyces sp. NPDC059627]
ALARLSPADQAGRRQPAWDELGVAHVGVVRRGGKRAAAMRLHRARGRLRAEIDRLRPPAAEALREEHRHG